MPTNRPVRRVDCNDLVYKTQREKFKAIIDEIMDCHTRGQPVLVGTISVETSELLSRMLSRVKIPHNVLNAKHHEREADIVARAGQAGGVTIATNMAGRGTDIKLGEGVIYLPREMILSATRLEDKVDGKNLRQTLLDKPCGLHVIGTERHESRRIDRQLRGRCARQGDPGSSRFYVSLEDDLMRLFGSDRIARVMERFGLEEGEVLEHRFLNRSIETAQRRVEQQNFSIRKRTLEYDDVMNKQREIIYGLRGDIVRAGRVREKVYDILFESINGRAEEMLIDGKPDGILAFTDWIRSSFPIGLKEQDIRIDKHDYAPVVDRVFQSVKEAYELKLQLENPDTVDSMERFVILQCIDSQWQDYLRSMDGLRQGVGLRAYGQRDPLVEYKREAFEMFGTLMGTIYQEISRRLFRSSTTAASAERYVRPVQQRLVHDEVALFGRAAAPAPAVSAPPPDPAQAAVADALKAAARPIQREAAKVGRNDVCPCGSGKKFKKCCGAGVI
jgi:preprotein translocase subunit SecA